MAPFAVSFFSADGFLRLSWEEAKSSLASQSQSSWLASGTAKLSFTGAWGQKRAIWNTWSLVKHTPKTRGKKMVGPGSHKSREVSSPLTVLLIFSDDSSSEIFLCYEALVLVDKILTATHCGLWLDIAVVWFFLLLFLMGFLSGNHSGYPSLINTFDAVSSK